MQVKSYTKRKIFASGDVQTSQGTSRLFASPRSISLFSLHWSLSASIVCLTSTDIDVCNSTARSLNVFRSLAASLTCSTGLVPPSFVRLGFPTPCFFIARSILYRRYYIIRTILYCIDDIIILYRRYYFYFFDFLKWGRGQFPSKNTGPWPPPALCAPPATRHISPVSGRIPPRAGLVSPLVRIQRNQRGMGFPGFPETARTDSTGFPGLSLGLPGASGR